MGFTDKKSQPVLPDTSTTAAPKTLNSTRKIDGVQHIAGRGDKEKADILFVSNCALEEEIDASTSPAAFLKSPAGSLFSRMALKTGIDLRQQYYIALVPIALPRKYKLLPPKYLTNYYAHLFEQTIKEVQPKIIVCLGKAPFDYLFGVKFKLSEIIGGVFYSQKYNTRIYVVDSPVKATYKPEMYDKLHIQLNELKILYDDVRDLPTQKVQLNYQYIKNSDQLKALVDKLKNTKYTLYAVDCEWAGSNFVDGGLRYFQFCWAPGQAACVMFRDTEKYIFDVSYERAGQILNELLAKENIRYVGHNITADAVFMNYVLGIETYQKVEFDTMFAEHLIDSAADLKLEKLAVKYTDLGRYDVDLLLYKKKAKIDKDAGYGSIPDDILGPYSCKDVDVCIRAYPILLEKLVRNKLYGYWATIRLPFIAEGFYAMTYTGVPCNVEDLNYMRDQFTFFKKILENVFFEKLRKEAEGLLFKELLLLAKDLQVAKNLHSEAAECKKSKDTQAINDFKAKIKTYVGEKDYSYLKYIFDVFTHYINVELFKHRSTDHLRKLLFDVKQYTPIMSTKTDDAPAIAWEKVLKLSPEEQKEYNPAVDKDVLKIYAEQGDDTIHTLTLLKKVETVTKNFVREDNQGLHKYVCSDGRVHSNLALTESGRPRSFHPNILNNPGYTMQEIDYAAKLCKDYFYKNIVPNKDFYNELFGENLVNEKFLTDPKAIRYNYKGEQGYCFTESDYDTAEVVALAYVSGDENMIKIVTEPDEQFALFDDGKNQVYKRICYLDDSTTITDDKKDEALLADVNSDQCVRNNDGGLIHPKRDVHWEFVEHKCYKNNPREKLDKKLDRNGGGKTGNFSVPYGGQASLLERKIEIATGIKPEAGTGDLLKKTYNERYPVASAYLDDRELDPEELGYFRSVTGAYRKYHVYREGDVQGLSNYARDKILAPIRREARNAPIQGIVADTLARAVIWLNRFFIKNDLKSRTIIPLYDACYSYGPLEERFVVKRAHEYFMSEMNTWNIHGRTLKFSIDTSFTQRWSTPLSEKEEHKFNDSSYQTETYNNLNWDVF